MKSKYLSLLIAFFAAANAHAQNIFPSTGSAGIGTTTPNASSILEMVSTSKGLLIPRMTKAQRDGIPITPLTPPGLLIYQTNNTPGFYYYAGTSGGWKAITPKASWWSLTGNGGTNPAINFIGTTDAQPMIFKVNNQQAGFLASYSDNTGFGFQTLTNPKAGANTANGYYALYANGYGYNNTANGAYALYSNLEGHNNTANGYRALFTNTAGYYNAATGAFSLENNISGIGNAGNGISALRNNTYGSDNTAVGANALYNNITGFSNVAVGSNVLFNNTAGSNLVAVGDSALYNQNGGYGYSTAVGSKALYSNTTGVENTANGYQALYLNTTGSYNTAFGYHTLWFNNGNGNTAIGAGASYNSRSGNDNTFIGLNADATNVGYSGSSAFGYNAQITASYQVRIGSIGFNSDPTSIGGEVGWTTLSDGRVKKNIKENVPGLAFINKLKAITYNLDKDAISKLIQWPSIKDKGARLNDDVGQGKNVQPSQQELDSRKTKEQVVYTGFVAQDVEAAAISLNYDFSGVDKPKNDKDLYGLRYSDFVVPLVKAVQELSAKNDELEARLQKLETLLSNQSVNNNQQSLNNNDAPKLEQNAPNPFKQNTVIKYYIPSNFQTAQLIITDVAGHNLKTYAISTTGNGTQMISGINLASGQYQYSLSIDGRQVATKKMEYLK
jgi:hypothetical protein